MEKYLEKGRNQQRQEQIKHDTEKLLQLATELKIYVRQIKRERVVDGGR